jgi:hypothetical protein
LMMRKQLRKRSLSRLLESWRAWMTIHAAVFSGLGKRSPRTWTTYMADAWRVGVLAERLRKTSSLGLMRHVAAIEAGELRGSWRMQRGRLWVILEEPASEGG